YILGGYLMLEIRKRKEKEGKYVYGIYKDEFFCLHETVEFSNYLKDVLDREHSTIEQKLTSIKYWYQFLESIKKDYDDFITTNDQKDFLGFLDNKENHMRKKDMYSIDGSKYEKGLEAVTVNRHLSNINEFYVYLVDHDYYNVSENIPFQEIRKDSNIYRRKEEETAGKYFTIDEVNEILSACKNIRDKVIVLTLVTTGMRVGELASLSVNNIEYDKRIINMKNIKELDIDKGKPKSEPRIIFISDVLFLLLKRYITFERNKYAKCRNLFIKLKNVRGEGVSDNTVQKMFERLKKRTGIEHCSAHTCRHTFSTHFMRMIKDYDNITYVTLSKLLGHKNIESTKIYTHLEVSDLKKLNKPHTDYWKKSLEISL
ncbi:MAG: tyrosine-type recombinase/integrase, partial [bacterium]